jgi:hypothetical protein
MAQFPKINGDYQPVMNVDSGSYVNQYPTANAVVSGLTVQPAGPFLAFYTVTAAGALTGTQVGLAIQATEQLATVMVYEYIDTTNDTLAMAVYPINAWTTTNLQANIRATLTAAGVANNVTVTATATFTGDTYPPTS